MSIGKETLKKSLKLQGVYQARIHLDQMVLMVVMWWTA
jgi:hypothetical protein